MSMIQNSLPKMTCNLKLVSPGIQCMNIRKENDSCSSEKENSGAMFGEFQCDELVMECLGDHISKLTPSDATENSSMALESSQKGPSKRIREWVYEASAKVTVAPTKFQHYNESNKNKPIVTMSLHKISVTCFTELRDSTLANNKTTTSAIQMGTLKSQYTIVDVLTQGLSLILWDSKEDTSGLEIWMLNILQPLISVLSRNQQESVVQDKDNKRAWMEYTKFKFSMDYTTLYLTGIDYGKINQETPVGWIDNTPHYQTFVQATVPINTVTFELCGHKKDAMMREKQGFFHTMGEHEDGMSKENDKMYETNSIY
ncbi:hypothetical protein BDF14DRAFT_82028 [Spinellus fusiger]|nr:hypothetical protein BDF14DRAFT_82028 [Spinellus fusiger]